MSKQWRKNLQLTSFEATSLHVALSDDRPDGLGQFETDLLDLVKKMAEELDKVPERVTGGVVSPGQFYTVQSSPLGIGIGFGVTKTIFADQYINSLFENELFQEKLRGFIADN